MAAANESILSSENSGDEQAVTSGEEKPLQNNDRAVLRDDRSPTPILDGRRSGSHETFYSYPDGSESPPTGSSQKTSGWQSAIITIALVCTLLAPRAGASPSEIGSSDIPPGNTKKAELEYKFDGGGADHVSSKLAFGLLAAEDIHFEVSYALKSDSVASALEAELGHELEAKVKTRFLRASFAEFDVGVAGEMKIKQEWTAGGRGSSATRIEVPLTAQVKRHASSLAAEIRYKKNAGELGGTLVSGLLASHTVSPRMKLYLDASYETKTSDHVWRKIVGNLGVSWRFNRNINIHARAGGGASGGEQIIVGKAKIVYKFD